MNTMMKLITNELKMTACGVVRGRKICALYVLPARGVTLLEVLLAVAILTLAILPLMGVFDIATGSTKKSMAQSVATSILVSIKQECEYVRFEDFGQLALAQPGVSPVEVPPEHFFPKSWEDLENCNVSGDYPEFACRVLCYPYEDGNSHLHRLEVAVSWQDKKGLPKEVKLGTLLISQKVY